MKRRLPSEDATTNKDASSNPKKVKPTADFWVEKTGNDWVRARLEREKARLEGRQKAAQERAQQNQQSPEEEEQRRIEEMLARQVTSFIPVVAGTELSTITVTAYRVVPLLPFAPPSLKVHTMMIRMKPNERLCFHGRVHMRVFEGCAQVFGHHFHASTEFHTLLSPFSSSALYIDAVAPTEAMLKLKQERGELRAAHQSATVAAARPQLHPAHTVLDEDIRNVLSAKRTQENAEGRWDGETVLILRSFYEKASNEEEEEGERGRVQQPISPSLASLRKLPASRYFLIEGKETNERRPPKLRVAPVVVESSDSDESEDAADEDKKSPQEPQQSEDVGDAAKDSEPSEQAMEVAPDAIDQQQVQPDQQQEQEQTTPASTIEGEEETRAEGANGEAGGAPEEPVVPVPKDLDDGADESEAMEAEHDDGAQQQTESAPTPTPAPKPTRADPNLLPEQRVDELVDLHLRIPGFYPLFPFLGNAEENVMQVPREWPILANSLVSFPAASHGPSQDAQGSKDAGAAHPPRVMITGRKGMGKSTISQYLLNSLLNRYSYVVFLDTDLGQPEFTPAGMVSLHVIGSPVYGPSFTHLATPTKAFFVGDVSVDEVFETHTQAVRSLVAHYYKATLPGTNVPLAGLPLIINTHGWLKGLGYEVLRDMVENARPDTAVHLYPIAFEHAQGPDFPFEGVEAGIRSVHTLPAVTTKRAKMSLGPDDLRRLRLDAYFNCWHEGSLVTQIPYRVPWNAVRLAFVDADVPPSECLLGFNASLVGLCVDRADYLSCAPPGQPDLSRGQSIYPSLLLSSPRCQCVGLGIVRTIDPTTHHFYVLTPVPLEQLQRVNTFVKGAIFLPAPTLLRGGWLSNPYLLDAISRAGSSKMTARANIKRKHLSK